MQAMEPLRTLAEQENRTLAKEAHTVLVEAERLLMGREGAKETGLREELQKKVDSLRDVLVKEPEHTERVREFMEKLRMVSLLSSAGDGPCG